MNKEEAKVRIDSIINHLEWRHGGGTDYVESDRDQAHQIIDQIELVHPKVKLPQEVIDELNDWQSDHQDGYTCKISELCGAKWDEDPDFPAVIAFAEKSEENYFKIIDAYRYGWEAEPEAKWYVKTPEAWESEDGDFGWLYKSIYGGVDTTSHGDGEEDEQFTRAEIKQYHLDSDIFTLVPVEEEK